MTWIDEWAAEFERTTGKKATLVHRGGGWYVVRVNDTVWQRSAHRRSEWERRTATLKTRPTVEHSEVSG